MKILLTILLYLIVVFGFSQTTSLSFTQLSSSPDFTYTPHRGTEKWNDVNAANIPVQGTSTARTDAYYRFQWGDVETGNRTYDWTTFDAKMNAAIDGGGKFSFSFMPLCPGCGASAAGTVSGAPLGYPLFLHTLMQAESTTDFITHNGGTGGTGGAHIGGTGGTNMWVPNWNSTNYITAMQNFCTDVNTHLNTTSHAGKLYANCVNEIDIRGFGSFGEWHSAYIVNVMADYPTGTLPTVATYEAIIDAHKNGFPNQQLQIMISTFDGNYFNNTMIPPEVGVYALQSRNSKGLYGWRRDNWSDLSTYLNNYLELNTRGFGTLPQMKDSIMIRYKQAPVTGEPNNQSNYVDIAAQIRFYNASSFGNGNYGGTIGANASTDTIRLASRLAGYRMTITSGTMTTALTVGTPFQISLTWNNSGVAPPYDNWTVTYELRNGSNVTVWTGTSAFNPKLFLTGSVIQVDNPTITGVTAGTYNLYVKVVDPTGIYAPMPLAITGRGTDGAYLLRSGIAVATSTPTIHRKAHIIYFK